MRATFPLCLFVVITAAACDAEPASQDATPSGLSEQLIGTWTDCDDDASQFSFRADGTYSFDEYAGGDNDDHVVGTYTVDGGVLTMQGTQTNRPPSTITVTAYANEQQLILIAGYPDGVHDGLVGTWTSDMRMEQGSELLGAVTTYELRTDGTGNLHQVPYGDRPSYERDGTWGPDTDPDNAGGYEFTYTEGTASVSVSFRMFDDQVLGSAPFCRITDEQ